MMLTKSLIKTMTTLYKPKTFIKYKIILRRTNSVNTYLSPVLCPQCVHDNSMSGTVFTYNNYRDEIL